MNITSSRSALEPQTVYSIWFPRAHIQFILSHSTCRWSWIKQNL